MYLPAGLKKLKYQEEAVLNARKVLDEYGGAFLSDVVGLGKTYMSALLVYAFYLPAPRLRQAGGLTPEEIKIVEGAAK
jgi:hypothetical protein